MVEEAYVSFETAKLLKKKGFMEDVIVKFFASGYDSKGNILDIRDTELKDYPRPTHQMAMKWLRDVHRLYIEVYANKAHNSKDIIFCPQVWDKNFHSIWRDGCFTTYEQACETAIKYCLENLI